ncbi:MAG TPA: hypothetical protein VFO39_18600 [Candidatus Sulfotelmatobacter sp.]|nr:hypothetical protein [Candidatus Sulfotelmatobacter sp.]
MKVEIDLQEKFGRDAIISFSDASIGERADDVERLKSDLQDLMTVFGGLAICVIEDRVTEIPDRHGILDEVMDLLEQYGATKIKSTEPTMFQ